MIRAENLSFGFPSGELFHNISFTIEDNVHQVLIGSNGSGKSTLVKLLLGREDLLYDGKIRRENTERTGLVSQLVRHDHETKQTVFEYLSRDFLAALQEQDRLCGEMGTSEDPDAVMEAYQKSLDLFMAIDGYNYESNIRKELATAGLAGLADLPVTAISGGEFKLVSIIRQMMRLPDLLIMDEPDVFLDFNNLIGLAELINSYQGSLLIITHNRFLLTRCFDRVLHLENGDLQVYEGNFTDYQIFMLQNKIELQKQSRKEADWIDIQEKLVEKLREDATRVANVSKGRSLKARTSYLKRLKDRQTRPPFVELRVPEIKFPVFSDDRQADKGAAAEKGILLTLDNFSVSYEKPLLSDVSFEIREGERGALVGPNGSGKSTLMRSISRNEDPAISFSAEARPGFLSQLYGDVLDEEKTVAEAFSFYFDRKEDAESYLSRYCFKPEAMTTRIGKLSGGEKNLLQLAVIALGQANLLLLDEPTSHLDLWSGMQLEKAMDEYKGAVLMVSHDFYFIADHADYVLYVEKGTVRKMSGRAFRKLIYRDHFSAEDLEREEKRKELTARIEKLLEKEETEKAEKLVDKLWQL